LFAVLRRWPQSISHGRCTRICSRYHQLIDLAALFAVQSQSAHIKPGRHVMTYVPNHTSYTLSPISPGPSTPETCASIGRQSVTAIRFDMISLPFVSAVPCRMYRTVGRCLLVCNWPAIQCHQISAGGSYILAGGSNLLAEVYVCTMLCAIIVRATTMSEAVTYQYMSCMRLRVSRTMTVQTMTPEVVTVYYMSCMTYHACTAICRSQSTQ
jgi:hypothetical protein